MIRHLCNLALSLAIAIAFLPGHAAEGGAVWAAKDISVALTVPGQDGAANTRLEMGANGDTRITVDTREGSSHTKGTIVLIAGRWMLTRGFTPTPGAEIDEMDAAALNSQLVIRLLSVVLPKGPPTPGPPLHVSFSEKANPIQVNTTSASGEYGVPWSVDGTVAVEARGAPATYWLRFTFSEQGRAMVLNLAGSIADSGPPLTFSDSMTLSGWTIHKIGTYQEQLPNGTKFDYGARPQIPAATTVGQLRKLQ
jgi:hypothetical protein